MLGCNIICVLLVCNMRRLNWPELTKHKQRKTGLTNSQIINTAQYKVIVASQSLPS